MVECADSKGVGRRNRKEGGATSQASHTHSPCLSLEGKQSLHSQGWAVKCLSFLPFQHLLPMAQSPSPLHLERKALARNKSGEYLKRIKCAPPFLIVGGGWNKKKKKKRNTSRFGVMHSAVSPAQSLDDSGGQGVRSCGRAGPARGAHPGELPPRGC